MTLMDLNASRAMVGRPLIFTSMTKNAWQNVLLVNLRLKQRMRKLRLVYHAKHHVDHAIEQPLTAQLAFLDLFISQEKTRVI
jgi:hypothetical protein